MPADEDWRLRARCIGVQTAWFFPEGNGSTVGREQKEFCAPCPVRQECLEDGLHERFGIRGGTSESERRRIRQARDRRSRVA